MNVKYRVDLDQGEREQLRVLSSGGKIAARRLKRVQILLAADAGGDNDSMAPRLGVSESTIYRTMRGFVEEELDAALGEQPRPGGARKLSGRDEALLVATGCSPPPEGRKRRSLTLLAAGKGSW